MVRNTTEIWDSDEMRVASSKHMNCRHCSSSQVGTIPATVMCLALALGFVILGGGLIIYGFGAALGALFTGHGQAIVFDTVLPSANGSR